MYKTIKNIKPLGTPAGKCFLYALNTKAMDLVTRLLMYLLVHSRNDPRSG